MSSSVSTDSVFERMAERETFASKSMKERYNPRQRNVEQPRQLHSGKTHTTPLFFHKMSSTGTFASSTRKWVSEPKSNAPRSSAVSPSDDSTFYNRLSQTDTFTSLSRKKGSREAEQMIKERVESTASDARDDADDVASRRKVDSSFFSRLAEQDTFASSTKKGMIDPTTNGEGRDDVTPPKRTDPSFFERMAKHETASSSMMKGKVNPNTTRPSSSKSAKKTTTSFFDRMAQQDTFASSTMKGKVHGETVDYQEKPKRKTNPDFFHRMANRETISSAQKRRPHTARV